MRLISRREARKRAGDISRTTEHRLRESDPDFPAVVQIAGRLTGYVEEEFEAYLRLLAEHRVPAPGHNKALLVEVEESGKSQRSSCGMPDARRTG